MDGFRVVGESFGYEALALLIAWIGCAGEAAMTPAMLELARFEAIAFERRIDLVRLGEILDELITADVTEAVATLDERELPMLVLIGRSGRMGVDTKGAARAVESPRTCSPGGDDCWQIVDRQSHAGSVRRSALGQRAAATAATASAIDSAEGAGP